MIKSAYYIFQNEGADQLRGNYAVDRRLSFRYIESTIHQPIKLCLPSSDVDVQLGLCRTKEKVTSRSGPKL